MDLSLIRILIAEDSRVVATMLKAIFEAEPDMKVVGCATNGLEAVRLTTELKPTLVTMDIQMPVMDGFEATCGIMSATPVPIVVVSSVVENDELSTSFRALREGALAVIEKPRGAGHREFERIRRELVTTVRTMAEVKVVTRRGRCKNNQSPPAVTATAVRRDRGCELIGVCCSTGGPQALQRIFSSLPGPLAVPMVIVQHISKGFVAGLARWLGDRTPLNVKVAENGEALLPNTAYLAPDELHLMVRREGAHLLAELADSPRVDGFRPSGTVLLRSVAEACRARGAGVVLTGMGADGADGLLAVLQAGGHTVVQDEVTSIIHSMPRAAQEIGAVERVVELHSMAAYLASLTAGVDPNGGRHGYGAG